MGRGPSAPVVGTLAPNGPLGAPLDAPTPSMPLTELSISMSGLAGFEKSSKYICLVDALGFSWLGWLFGVEPQDRDVRWMEVRRVGVSFYLCATLYMLV